MMTNSKEAIISPVGTRMIKIEKIAWVGHTKKIVKLFKIQKRFSRLLTL